ncbi:MAG: hypothetical protein ACR2GV_07995 [Gaiellaceae bacterium]
MSVPKAIAHLEKLEWQAVTDGYLRGEIEMESLHLHRWHADGSIEILP